MWNVKRVNDLIVISKTGKQLNLKIYIKLKTKKKNEKKQSIICLCFYIQKYFWKFTAPAKSSYTKNNRN